MVSSSQLNVLGFYKSFLIRFMYRLKALVAIPKVQPRYAVAVWKKYPSMKSLLKVYMDPNISVSAFFLI